MKNAIADGSVVTIHYTLRDGDGSVLDSSAGGAPFDYLHGAGNLVPGLERELTGRSVGDKLDVVVAPADGYGERTGITDKVPRGEFQPGADIEVGMQVFARTDSGDTIPLWVIAADAEHITVAKDHPLAGVTLHFAIEVTAIRVATAEELDHGHPHGPGGHGH
jgi:FKBP-type peptidyl-prolyl cis-trans isomerase SlyD